MSGETSMPHLMLPRDRWEPKDRHQEVESRLKQNRSGRYEEDIVITVQGTEAHIKGEAQTEVKFCSRTTNATTATNRIFQENIWIDVPQKKSRVIFAIKLDISNVPVEGSVEISEDGEQ